MSEHEVADLLARLAQTPFQLARMVTAQDQSILALRHRADAWSADEILAHVRAADDILSYRVYALLVRDNPLLPALDERSWASMAGYDRMDFFSSLTTFTARRAELVAALQRLPLSAWQRTGIHDVNGAFTLWTLVQHLVTHEEEHCQQLATFFTP